MDSSVSNDTLPAPTVVWSWSWQAVCKTVLAVVGLVGNALVIAVYRRKRRQRASSSANVLILALACADLVSSLNFFPQPVLLAVPSGVWGELYCRLVFSQASLWISIEASVYTLTLLSVERYAAVVHPMRYKRLFAGAWPRRFVCLIWLFALAVKSFNFYTTAVGPAGGCVYVSLAPGLNLVVALGVALVEYFVPIGVMSFCNLRASRALRNQARNLRGGGGGGGVAGGAGPPAVGAAGPAERTLQTRRRLHHMVLLVIATFVVCWTPDQISLLLMNLGVLPFEHFNGHLHQAFVVLAFSNSCANPIIYTFKNKQFRASVLDLFRKRPARVGALGSETGSTVNVAVVGQRG